MHAVITILPRLAEPPEMSCVEPNGTAPTSSEAVLWTNNVPESHKVFAKEIRSYKKNGHLSENSLPLSTCRLKTTLNTLTVTYCFALQKTSRLPVSFLLIERSSMMFGLFKNVARNEVRLENVD